MITAAIIDDDKDTVEVFAEYLKFLDVKVVAVGYNGKQATEIYKKHKPDVLFLDLLMPEYDGVYGLREIRAVDPDAKVVIITADLRKDIEDKLEGLNPTEIILKPFDVDKIKLVIGRLKMPKSPDVTTTDVKKALVSFTITEALLKIGPSATNEVGDRLYTKYHCYFSDCLEHPEYLKEVLHEIFGAGSTSIVKTIRENLAKLEDQQPIADFLAVLGE